MTDKPTPEPKWSGACGNCMRGIHEQCGRPCSCCGPCRHPKGSGECGNHLPCRDHPARNVPPTSTPSGEPNEQRSKVSYIGAPACFSLEMACKQVQDAFSPNGNRRHGQVYVVGSALERADWRDIDVRMILDDDSFKELFPDVRLDTGAAIWEFDPRWTLMCTVIAQWMRAATGLPIDFQFQPMTWANQRHNKPRHAAGLRYARPEETEQ